LFLGLFIGLFLGLLIVFIVRTGIDLAGGIYQHGRPPRGRGLRQHMIIWA